MFVQIIQGHVADAEELKAALDRWARELAPGSIGWLGTTAGVAADDTFIALVRFESEAAARRNSERPEQHQWWMETAKLFAGDVTFHDCPDALTFLDGGSDEAGFVQVIQARGDAPDQMQQRMEQQSDELRQIRPDVIGGLFTRQGDREFTQAIYFTSEEAARQGERDERFQQRYTEEIAPQFEQIRYFDLRRPWLYSPK
jgi:hypothetical protein